MGGHETVFIAGCHHARYLADLMDSAELIRNVALVGHLHCGKVCSCVEVAVCVCVI